MTEVKMSDPITLETPINRGDTTIAEIKLRKPQSGELRGLSMVDIAKLEVETLHTLIPRISVPTLNEADVLELDPSDLFAISTEVAEFLLPKAIRKDSQKP